MLTAKSQSVDKVVGLELGADDYITKPFDTKELLARIRAIQRRFSKQEGRDRDGALRLGPLELDPDGYTVTKDGEPLELTPTEFKILALLMRRPGRAFTRTQISEAVSTGSHYLASRYIDVHISRLRAKVEHDPREPRIIQTVPSVGYRAARPPATASSPRSA
jgi:DNA-binding response OmpR family regulator